MSIVGGFTTIMVVIGVGFLLARFGILSNDHQHALSTVAFYAGTPCLLFTTMQAMQVQRAFAMNIVVTTIAALIAMVTYVVVNRLLLHGGVGEMVIGCFCSGYVNAANLGLPIAYYVLGDVGWMAPVLLVQTVVLQPIGVTILDIREARYDGRRYSWLGRLVLPVRNPITVGALAGLLVNLSGMQLPKLVMEPISLIGQVSIPGLLIAFGISMFFSGRPGVGEHRRQFLTVLAIKLVWFPLVAIVLATAVFGLDAHTVLVCAVVAALPSAQNIFVIAQRYRVGVDLARDAIFVDTLAAIPVLFLIATVLGT